MERTTRRVDWGADLPAIADLIAATPETARHRIDFPWRLSSPTLQSPGDARLWEVPGGRLAGFAAWQMWWATLDFYVRPGPDQHEVEAAIFTWAARHFRTLDAARGRPLPYWAEAREDDTARRALLERHGYALDDDHVYVMLQRSVQEPLPDPVLPPGFAIRPLAGASEVKAYAAMHRRAFASTSMTAAWRARTLQMPQYRAELDLVAVAQDDRIAGFCVGWLAADGHVAQIEPLGIDPDFKGIGLGSALLLAMLARFQAAGVAHALVETESTRLPALRAYEAAGFRTVYRALRKGQRFA